MKVRTIEYVNTKGQLVDYFIDYTQGNKRITAGTILDVSEGRARELMGENPLNIKFAELLPEDEDVIVIEEDGQPLAICSTAEEKTLYEMARDELFELANTLEIKAPKNISTANLIKKIEEKQNS